KEEPSVVNNGEVTVRNWRHRLQRAFLGKSDVNEKMMPDIDEVFKSIEAFEMKMEWLTSSKLGKVLKQVGALDNSKVPLDEKDKGRGDAHRTGTAVVSNEDEKKDDDTEAKDQEKGDLKAAEGKSDKDEIKEDGKKMDCSDSPQPETTKAGESGDANGMD
ncbi:hypothetical protein PPACK8108_LOCUS2707, partial [Phakopsora pachyrhizi]